MRFLTFVWWPFKKIEPLIFEALETYNRFMEKKLDTLKAESFGMIVGSESFETDCRLIQVSLFGRLKAEYSLTWDDEGSAGLLAAQVGNYLKGDDIAAVIEGASEPNKSAIARIQEQLPARAAKVMAEDRCTREVIVATLRMIEALEFARLGENYLHSDHHRRIYELLSTFGPEFPEQINPKRYKQLAQRYYQDGCGSHRTW